MFKTMLKDQKGSAQNWILGIAFILIIGVGIYALVFKSTSLKPTAQKTKTPAYDPSVHQVLTTADIALHPNVFEGKNVELLRVIARDWVTDRSFLIDDVVVQNSTFGSTSYQSSHPLLVMRRDPFSLPENAPDGVIALGEQNKLVHIQGVVRFFDIDTFQKTWGITFSSADALVLKKYIGKPVLVITEVKDYVSKK